MAQARSARETGNKTRAGRRAQARAVAARPRRVDLQSWLAVAAMIAAVLTVYVPVAAEPGQNTLIGLDYLQLHVHRIRFAQEALFGPHPHLPGWYPRELLGTPFWSNIQNFPFLPTRLLLLACDPLDALAVGVNLAAVLAALFTFLYARRIGLSRWPSAVAGWTFACAGFYASRVMAGHLPLLEAYPALPLLLWLVERWRAAPPAGRSRSMALLALWRACGCIALAGHPQLPIYAITAAALYSLYRTGIRQGARAVAAMGAGGLSAAFALWPLWRLVGRSARMLALDPANNDIAFPYRRLIAFVLPWGQGWPLSVDRFPNVPFSLAFPDQAYFWETVVYIGWLPLLAALFLLARALVRRKMPERPWLFLVALAVGGLLLALPAARLPFSRLPGTFLHSPSRLMYFTTFGLALGLGAAVDVLAAWARSSRRHWVLWLLALGLAAHLLDLRSHDRHFIRMWAVDPAPSAVDDRVRQAVGDGRVAMDSGLWAPLNRRLDDIGYFDSIALAKSYAALLDLGGKSPRFNTQYIDGSDLNVRALAACGVKVMLTQKGPGGPGTSNIHAFPIPNPAPRVAFYPQARAQWLETPAIHQDLRDPHFDLQQWLMLPREAANSGLAAATPASPPSAAARPAEIAWQRDSEDQATIDVNGAEAGYVRWLEAWDPGWSATVDGTPARVLPADDVFMAVAVSPGPHTVRLSFSTPGATTGILISVMGLVLLAAISFVPFAAEKGQKTGDGEEGRIPGGSGKELSR
jgi:hypothetical protein